LVTDSTTLTSHDGRFDVLAAACPTRQVMSRIGDKWTLLTLFALGEFVTDQLPTTPSRTVPVQFAARLVTGGLSGAAIGAARDNLIAGFIAGVLGAVIGTLGGRQFRGALAKALQRLRDG